MSTAARFGWQTATTVVCAAPTGLRRLPLVPSRPAGGKSTVGTHPLGRVLYDQLDMIGWINELVPPDP